MQEKTNDFQSIKIAGGAYPESAYIHIPFCVQKCLYCDFISFTKNNEKIEQYIECVKKEIELTRLELNKPLNGHFLTKSNPEKLQTIYFGGGTPSVLPPAAIEQFLIALTQHFGIEASAEITIEVNPGTITDEKLQIYKSIGINRLSVGVQSFSDDVLKKAGRIHSAKEARLAIEMIQNAGFTNINCDLMTGLPGQTLSDAENSLYELVKYQIPHISFYALGIEENTPFYQIYLKHPDFFPSVEDERKMHHRLLDILRSEKYKHYEISNCAIQGFESRHNINYWKAESYFGFGCGAHSYYRSERRGNTSDLDKYIMFLSDEHAKLSSVQQIEEKINLKEAKKEFILLGLRILDGISEAEYRIRFQSDMQNDFGPVLNKLKSEGYLDMQDNKYCIARDKLDYANHVFREFV